LEIYVMNLQINGTNVQFGFPLQTTGTNAVKEVLFQPISDKLQYKIEVSYTVKAASLSEPQAK
jgi:hypothetical protein